MLDRTEAELAAGYASAAKPGDVVIVADVFARDGEVDAVARSLEAHAAASQRGEGVLLFALHRDRFDPAHFVVIEVYGTFEDLERHRGTERYKAMMADLLPRIGGRGRMELQPIDAGDPARGRVR